MKNSKNKIQWARPSEERPFSERRGRSVKFEIGEDDQGAVSHFGFWIEKPVFAQRVETWRRRVIAIGGGVFQSQQSRIGRHNRHVHAGWGYPPAAMKAVKS